MGTATTFTDFNADPPALPGPWPPEAPMGSLGQSKLLCAAASKLLFGHDIDDPPPPYSSCHPVPHKCPVCDGKGRIFEPPDDPRPCPCCKGTCVVWKPPSDP